MVAGSIAKHAPGCVAHASLKTKRRQPAHLPTRSIGPPFFAMLCVCADEGRVQSSAAAFTKGLLDLEGAALTPILVRWAGQAGRYG